MSRATGSRKGGSKDISQEMAERLWPFLCENLKRTMSEMHEVCKSNPKYCASIGEILQTSLVDFQKLQNEASQASKSESQEKSSENKSSKGSARKPLTSEPAKKPQVTATADKKKVVSSPLSSSTKTAKATSASKVMSSPSAKMSKVTSSKASSPKPSTAPASKASASSTFKPRASLDGWAAAVTGSPARKAEEPVAKMDAMSKLTSPTKSSASRSRATSKTSSTAFTTVVSKTTTRKRLALAIAAENTETKSKQEDPKKTSSGTKSSSTTSKDKTDRDKIAKEQAKSSATKPKRLSVAAAIAQQLAIEAGRVGKSAKRETDKGGSKKGEEQEFKEAPAQEKDATKKSIKIRRPDRLNTPSSGNSRSSSLSPARKAELHKRLSSPDRKSSKSSVEAKMNLQAKQYKAEKNRKDKIKEKEKKIQEKAEKFNAIAAEVEAKQQEERDRIQNTLSERLAKAKEVREEHLENIRNKAGAESMKVKEINFILSMTSGFQQDLKRQEMAKRLKEGQARREEKMEARIQSAQTQNLKWSEAVEKTRKSQDAITKKKIDQIEQRHADAATRRETLRKDEKDELAKPNDAVLSEDKGSGSTSKSSKKKARKIKKLIHESSFITSPSDLLKQVHELPEFPLKVKLATLFKALNKCSIDKPQHSTLSLGLTPRAGKDKDFDVSPKKETPSNASSVAGGVRRNLFDSFGNSSTLRVDGKLEAAVTQSLVEILMSLQQEDTPPDDTSKSLVEPPSESNVTTVQLVLADRLVSTFLAQPELFSPKTVYIGSQIVQLLCGKAEIRRHLLFENKVVPLVDVLCSKLDPNWPTYFPNLFHILTLVLSEPLSPDEAKNMKYNIFRYISLSGLIHMIADFFVQAVLDAAKAHQATAADEVADKDKDLKVAGSKKNKKKGKKKKLTSTSSSSKLDKATAAANAAEVRDPHSIYLHIVQFLGAITSLPEFRSIYSVVYEANDTTAFPLAADMKVTGMAGILSVIGAVTLQPNINLRTAHQKLAEGESYPEIVVIIILAAFKALNNMGRLDLALLQEFASECSQQLYHILQLLLAYCTTHYEDSQPVRSLLNELLLFIGYCTLQNEQLQDVFRWSQTPTLLQRLCNLPFNFFCDAASKNVLFPALITICFRNKANKEVMQQEVHTQFLYDYLTEQMKTATTEEMAGSLEADSKIPSTPKPKKKLQPSPSKKKRSPPSFAQLTGNTGDEKDDANLSVYDLRLRFPPSLWVEASAFFEQ
mmetsp:Transcript_36062/g.70893  ORF Transcript_36062/g.70893 Transcript_36062/m.70893 type:complete len:1235 (+) Transcript_36062:33-3737(+)